MELEGAQIKRVRRCAGQPFHADDRASVSVGQRDEAAIDRFELWTSERIAPEEGYGASAAFALGAAFFRAGAARGAQPLEQRAMGVDIIYDDGLPVDLEHRRRHVDSATSP